MEVAIGISNNNLLNSIRILTFILSNEMVLYVKTRKFHWNVSGENFMEIHKLFENQYIQLKNSIDDIAERISKLGGKPVGTMKEYTEMTNLKEAPGTYPPKNEMLKELLQDYNTIIQQLRIDIPICNKNDDEATADFLIGLMEQHETCAWILRRYLS